MPIKWMYGLAGAGAFLGSLALSEAYMSNEVNNYDASLTYPPLTSIVMPTYNEEPWIESTLQSLIQQNIFEAYPDRFELIIADSQSRDHTVDIARRYTSNVLSVPKGKLTAKHLAILHANGEIIVTVDADTYYPCNWLNLILTHFEDPSIVAIGGCSTAKHPSIFIKLGYVMQSWYFALAKNTLTGRGTAFTKNAYLQIGGYYLDFDQTEVDTVQYWEEMEICERLKEIGKVVIDLRARVVTSPRLFYCVPRTRALGIKLLNGMPYEEFCRQVEERERM